MRRRASWRTPFFAGSNNLLGVAGLPPLRMAAFGPAASERNGSSRRGAAGNGPAASRLFAAVQQVA